MAGNVRVTYGRRSRVPGTTVGVQVNTFGLDKLMVGVNGEAMAEVGLRAMQPAFDQAYGEWAVLTGASRDSISLFVGEVGPKHCRIVLQAGGPQLISDPRNVDKKDYAPYLEFNGSPSGSQAPGVLSRAIYGNDSVVRDGIHRGIRQLIEDLNRE